MLAVCPNTYSGCQKYVPFTAVLLRWQGISLFESGQFPSPLVGGITLGVDRLGTRQCLLYAWEAVCKSITTVQKIVPS